MAILKIDKLLDREQKNRVEKVGIELEGAWTKINPGTNVHRDTSVKNFPENITFKAIGEVASPAMYPALIEPWVRKNYPTHVNESCGLHIHQSFGLSALNYMRLMDKSYQDTLLDYLKQWAEEEKLPKSHSIWDRLEGKSEYCQLKHWPEKQVRQIRKDYDRTKDGHRYTVINYCHGLNNMQTIEVRVLPMFETPEQSSRALWRIVNVTNACLIMLGRREKETKAEFSLGNSSGIKDRTVSIYR